MRRFVARLLISLTFVASTTAWAADTWQPAGKWNLDMSDAACTLARTYAIGQQQLTIGFDTKPLSNDFWLLLVGPESLFNEVPDLPTPIAIGVPGGAPVSGDLLVDGLVGPGMKKVRIKVGRAALDNMLAARSISLDGAGSHIIIAMESNAGVVVAMRGCEEDLYKRLKLDPSKLAAVAVWPEPIMFLEKLSTNDYPTQALQEKLQGQTKVLLSVDEKGKVRGCKIFVSSGSKLLDQTTCELMWTRATFRPASDKAGHPIQAWARMDFTWRIPGT